MHNPYYLPAVNPYYNIRNRNYKRVRRTIQDHILENIFSYLSLKDLRNCAQVCRSWHHILNDENSYVWRLQCTKRLAEEVLKSDLLSNLTTYKAKLRAFYNAWSPYDCSRNIYIKPNGFTLHRNPVAQSTDACRGKIGYNRGRHAWEVIWEGPLGTVAVIGVSTKEAPLQCQGYVGLLGSDEQSWGWNLVDNYLIHNGDTQGRYPLLNNCPKYQVGERIRVILDCEGHTLSFERGYEFLGVAFRGLPLKKKLYPTVSAVYGNTEVSMVYLGPPLDDKKKTKRWTQSGLYYIIGQTIRVHCGRKVEDLKIVCSSSRPPYFNCQQL